MKQLKRVPSLLVLATALIFRAGVAHAANDAAELAKVIAADVKVQHGLVIDVGCAAAFDLELARLTHLFVHAIESDAQSVAAAREQIAAAGFYGTSVSVSCAPLSPLPLPSNCASLVVCGDQFSAGLRGRDFKELFRILSPNGIAFIGQSSAVGKSSKTPLTREELEKWLREAGIASFEVIEKDGVWARISKPFEPGWDEWPQRSHDAGNSYSSRDTIAGTVFKPQWVSDFRPGLSSSAVAIANGRIFVASLEYAEAPAQTPYLQALDAFTGVELWSRVGKKSLPVSRPPGVYSNRENCSDIAVAGDALYLLGGKQCFVFSTKTGETTATFSIPAEAHADEADAWLYLSCVGNTLYGAVGKPPAVQIDWNSMHYRGISRAIFALDRLSGKLLWINTTPASICSLCAGPNAFYFCEPELKLHALNAKDGTDLFHAALPYEAGSEVAGCALYQEKLWLLYNPPEKDKQGHALLGLDLIMKGRNSRQLDVFSSRDGAHLFACEFGMTIAGFSFSGNFVIGSHQHGFSEGGAPGLSVCDATTGALKWVEPGMAKLRCTPTLCTPNLILRRGPGVNQVIDATFLGTNVLAPGVTSFTGFRSSCTYPGIPAYGMLFVQGEGCACQSPIRGNIALAPASVDKAEAKPDKSERLVKGKAFDAALKEDDASWPCSRGDLARNGKTSEKAAAALHPLWTWQRDAHGPEVHATNVAVDRSRVYFGSTDHCVYAVDCATGKTAWRRICDGAIHISPFLWKGRVFIGDDGGTVRCLNAENGEDIWNFRATLGVNQLIADGRPISRWPVMSGVVIGDETAYFCAGMFPDDGAMIYALDAKTGVEKWQQAIEAHSGNFKSAFAARGEMALANGHLFIPSGASNVWEIDLQGKDHAPQAVFNNAESHTKGEQIMIAGNKVIAVSPNLQFIHHVRILTGDPLQRLPVVDEAGGRLFIPNQRLPDGALYLAAGKKAAFDYDLNHQAAIFALRKEYKEKALEECVYWKAWKNEQMTALIQSGDTLFSGGKDNVYATSAADGKELWSEKVPGEVQDLAFAAGRLFVVTDSGAIVCFGQ